MLPTAKVTCNVFLTVVFVAANGLDCQFDNFYEGVGYSPKVDPGHDAQTFASQAGGKLAEKAAAVDASPTEGPLIKGLAADVFDDFHSNVGYARISDPGSDAQVFASSSAAVYAPAATMAETSAPAGELAANGLPRGAYSEFHENVGYAKGVDPGADAQIFSPVYVE